MFHDSIEVRSVKMLVRCADGWFVYKNPRDGIYPVHFRSYSMVSAFLTTISAEPISKLEVVTSYPPSL